MNPHDRGNSHQPTVESQQSKLLRCLSSVICQLSTCPLTVNLRLLLLLFATTIIYSTTTPQTIWYKYPGNPVFEYGKSDEWDQAKFAEVVLFEDGQYHMWYKGWSDYVPGFLGIGYASSPDGIHWQKYEANPVEFKFETDDWAFILLSFDIIKKDSVYFMWYTGLDNTDTTGCIGFAWSNDGLGWTKHPQPVVKPGKEDEWDGGGIYEGVKVFFDGKRYQMWYNATNRGIRIVTRIGYATSDDGLHWEKHPANPVLDVGEPGSWDDHHVDIHSVNFNGSCYEMWYDGFDLINTQVGYASSADGFNWTKSPENPVVKIGELGSWDTWIARIPIVVSHDSIYRMWYYGHNNARGSIGYATTSSGEALAWDTSIMNKLQRIIKVQIFNREEYIKVDSLAGILPKLSGIELIDALNKLALVYSLNDSKKSLKYAEKAMDLAKKINYPEGRAMALYSIGNSYYVMDNYSDALANQLSALRLFDSLDMQFELANLLSQIAGIHSYAGSHDLACRYHKQALNVFEKLNDTGFIMHSLIYLGYANLWYGDTVSAIKAFQRRLSLAKAINDKWRQVDSYEALGLCYSGRILDSALYYFIEANKIWKEQHSRDHEYYFLISAEACFAGGPQHYDEAEKLFLKARERITRQNRVRMLYGMAELYFNTGRYDKAKEFLNVSFHECQTFLNKQNHQMFTYLNQKLEYEMFLKPYMEKIYWLYYRLDTVLHDKDLAFTHFKLATQWKDSMQNEQNRRQWAMMQGQYETEASQSKITLLEKDNEVKSLTLMRSRIYLAGLGVFVLIIILGAIIFIRQRKIRAQHALELERVKSEKLKELDKLKSRFFANISHEFRTPLTLIMGPLEKVLAKAEDDMDIKELGIAKKYTGKLQILINNLLTISKLESGKLQLRASEMDVVKLIRSYLQSFESLAKQKNIELKFTSENKEILTFIDREKFELIMNNLMSNAFKYTEDGGTITVTVSAPPQSPPYGEEAALFGRPDLGGTTGGAERVEWVKITVSDTGCGIAPEHIDHVFDRFYQVERADSNYYKGTGIGLALTREMVELHHGIIKVDSELGKGSTFTILLPLGKEHLTAEEIVDNQQLAVDSASSEPGIRQMILQDQSQSEIPPPSNIDNRQLTTGHPILLIAEDNADMRSYIRGYFDTKYRIIEAVDGLDGYEKSIEHIPDIIISDVMMPKMDGNAFCRKVKTDERTSHIPVILLTARASKENRIEGLETEADDFITKPFDGDELQVRVKNLIVQRKKLQAFYRKDLEVNRNIVKEEKLSMDEMFLQKAKMIVTKNLSNPQYEVTDFATEMAMSRIQLYRKLRALVDNSVTEFIRNIRLNLAAELIKKKAGSLSGIAYDVGFNNPSYFSICFRNHFGVSPTEYQHLMGDSLHPGCVLNG